ncbi:hypothetical protein PV327_001027 [Microctonus hyperodae]|uniref:CDAN1-interacting nuclease 1 n=1 Tax=Microctonus hyperodae TaxID=165561 RepID=A0AA39G7F9_MICHY|nr:hypothetical protein PV327_001027 [Microctonus hyperodae]
MKKKLYDEIVEDISKYRGLTRDCADMLIKKYPKVSSESLHSIVSSELTNRLKKSRNLLYGSRHNYLGLFRTAQKNGQPPGIIVRIASDVNLPPALLARRILEQYYQNAQEGKVSRSTISRLLKDTGLIEDMDLAYEISLCILYDDRCGFISDAFCAEIGREYEVKLQNILQEHKISYITEDDLRSRGYDKTPDIKLEVPIAINGFVINWIESKARFATPSIHKTYIKEQFLSYWNRFGPGLVIYWFGFVDEIVEQAEKKYAILDHFPENITYMNPMSVQNLI